MATILLRCRWIVIVTVGIFSDPSSGPCFVNASDGTATGLSADGIPPDDSAGERAEWVARHQGYRSEIASGDLRYLRVALFPNEPKVAQADAIERLQGLDISDPHRAAREIVGLIEPRLLADDDESRKELEYAVASQRLLVQGDKERSFGRNSEHLVVNRLHLYQDAANRELRGFHRGNCPLFFFPLTWFRNIPQEEEVMRAGWSEMGQGSVVLGAPDAAPGQGSRLRLELSDGLPRLRELVYSESGATFKVSLSEGYVQFPGDVLFPVLRADLEIRDGLVKSVMATILESAEFNRDLPDEEFVLSAPRGWHWHDFRSEGNPGGVLDSPVQDAVAFFEGLSPGPIVQSRESGTADSGNGWGYWMPLILILNGLLFIGLGVALSRSSNSSWSTES